MNKNKTLKAIVMLLVMVVLCGIAFTSNAAVAEAKKVTVTSATGKVGDTVKVEIKAKSDLQLTDEGFLLKYDSTKLQLTKYTKANVGSGMIEDNKVAEGYTLGYVFIDPAQVKAGTVLSTLEFKILTGATGNIPLTLVCTSENDTTVATSNVTVLVPATEVKLDQTDVELAKVGDTVTLKATVTPANSTDKVVWTSSDEKVATVKDGKVTMVGKGYVIITATAGKAVASTTVMVPNPLTGIKAPETLTIKVGEKKPVELEPVPSNPTDYKEATWETDNKNVVIVDEQDNIVGVKEGTATLTYKVTTQDGKTFTAKTKVTVVKAEEVKKPVKGNSVGHKMGDMNVVMYVVVAVVSLGAVATVATLRKRNLNK